MTTKQHLELDAFIAENVMGWKESKSPMDATYPCFMVWGHGVVRYENAIMQTMFSPTTDPAAAMMVLEKCCSEKIVAMIVERTAKGDWMVGEPHGGANLANTLPLAIGLFAKKLFSCNQTS